MNVWSHVSGYFNSFVVRRMGIMLAITGIPLPLLAAWGESLAVLLGGALATLGMALLLLLPYLLMTDGPDDPALLKPAKPSILTWALHLSTLFCTMFAGSGFAIAPSLEEMGPLAAMIYGVMLLTAGVLLAALNLIRSVWSIRLRSKRAPTTLPWGLICSGLLLLGGWLVVRDGSFLGMLLSRIVAGTWIWEAALVIGAVLLVIGTQWLYGHREWWNVNALSLLLTGAVLLTAGLTMMVGTVLPDPMQFSAKCITLPILIALALVGGGMIALARKAVTV